MPKTIYERALEHFTFDEQKEIKKKINKWSKEGPYGPRITRNLPKELFLPVKSMKSLLQAILNDTGISIEELEYKYQNECYKHGLLGGDIKPHKYPNTFGVAIERCVFERHLHKKYKKNLHREKDRKEFIEALTNSLKIGSKYADYPNFRLKEFSVWSTWNNEDLSKFPFEFTETLDAQEIRANLGLTEIDTSKQLLLFVYQIPEKIKPQKGTIADAGLYQYFEPPVDASDGHGWTINRHEKPVYKRKKYNIRSRPECIHNSIELKSLIKPIEKRI